jgi:hypothetical protein
MCIDGSVIINREHIRLRKQTTNFEMLDVNAGRGFLAKIDCCFNNQKKRLEHQE